MSTAAPAKPNANGYSVARPVGKCAQSGRDILPGEKMMALLRETPVGLERVDISMEAWPTVNHEDALAYWQNVMPAPEQQKKRLFVDDEVLATLFERLADTTEPNKIGFRFVLGLILMRKRVLVYESTETENGQNVWVVRFKGKEPKLRMTDPHLTEEQIKSVTGQLGEIMNEEL